MSNLRRGALAWLSLSLIAAGCGGAGAGGVMTDDEVVTLCDALIAEVEAGSSAEQLEAFAQITLTVAGYGYVPPPPPPGDTATLEPTGAPQLYRMYGVMALMHGSLAAGLWASAQATRLQPADPTALAQTAVMLMERQRCADARALLEKARQEDRAGDELLRLSLASAHACLGETAKVIEAVTEAAELAPGRAVVEQAQRSLYDAELSQVAAVREGYASACSDDLVQALNLGTFEELGAYVQLKNQESQALATELINMYLTMPFDLPTQFYSDVTTAQDRYLADYSATLEGPATRELDRIQSEWEDASDAMAQAEADCCAAASQPCCGCIYAYCADNWAYVEDHADPDSLALLASYLPGSVRQLGSYELELLGILLRYRDQASASAGDWAARYAYGLLATSCKTVGLQVANIEQPPLMYRDWAEANYEAARSCSDAAAAAAIEAARQRAEDERAAALAEAERQAAAAQDGKDPALRAEVCLDSIGCLGIDGSQFSIKAGSDVFAQLSVDVDKFEVGVRVGVGVGDPTGNLWGMDVSVGGTVSSQGTSFDVTASQGLAAGTVKQDVTLFKSQFKF